VSHGNSTSAEDEPLDGDGSATLVESYWEALSAGENPSPEDWLETHPESDPNLLGRLSVVALIHRSQALSLAPAKPRAGDEAAPADSPPAATTTPAGLLPRGTPLEGGDLSVVELIDGGGMGEVYLAWQKSRSSRVVVKLAHVPAIEPRFQREIDIQYRLGGHKHIVVARHAGQHEGRSYLVMEYVAGPDLQRFVRRYGPLHWREACAYIRQAALGLDHAHALGIIHRDIKPSNLVRDNAGPGRTIKIIDWGLALLKGDRPRQSARGAIPAASTPSADDLSSCSAHDATQAGSLLGTREFISPEQIHDPSGVEPASDLYSLGCTFHYLLTGKPPFGDQLDRPLIPPVLPPELVVPAPVEQVLRTLLRHEPSDRYRSARELVEVLDDILERSPGPGWSGGPRWSSMAALLLVAGALALALGWLRLNRPINRNGPERPDTVAPIPLTEFAAPALDQLNFRFDRGGWQDPYAVVKAGRGLDVRAADPLGPNDFFIIDGLFRQPTYWYVIWFDTNGGASLDEAAPDRRSDIRFPLEPSGRMRPDKNDPPGTHMILLAAGSMPPDQVKARLEKLLSGIGKPPALNRRDPWHIALVGDAGADKPADPTRSGGAVHGIKAEDRWASDYLADIRQRLRGAPVQPLHAFFVSTQP